MSRKEIVWTWVPLSLICPIVTIQRNSSMNRLYMCSHLSTKSAKPILSSNPITSPYKPIWMVDSLHRYWLGIRALLIDLEYLDLCSDFWNMIPWLVSRDDEPIGVRVGFGEVWVQSFDGRISGLIVSVAGRLDCPTRRGRRFRRGGVHIRTEEEDVSFDRIPEESVSNGVD